MSDARCIPKIVVVSLVSAIIGTRGLGGAIVVYKQQQKCKHICRTTHYSPSGNVDTKMLPGAPSPALV